MIKRVGYSYGRFSSGPQEEGDSTRRQDTGAETWCKRNGVELDQTARYFDKGTSAFRGKHRKAGTPLRAFLDEVEADRIPRGSVLVIENLDRLDRENPWDAVPNLCQIVNAGIDVVTLSPSEMVYSRSGNNLAGLILAVVEFSRGHSESKSKSDRLTALWDGKKAQARENGTLITRRIPEWLEVHGKGKLVPREDRVAVLESIFTAAARGDGLYLIVKSLTGSVKPWGRGKAWTKAYVRKIITGKAVLGQHQPLKLGKPDGKPIMEYYPAVIAPDLWQRANDALATRRQDKAGAIGEKVTNLFSGLLTDARTGKPMLIAWQTQGSGKARRKARMLVPSGAMDGNERSITLPYGVFESALLSFLQEINPADVYGTQPQSQVSALTTRRDALAKRMADIEAELAGDGGDVPALARVLRTLDVEYQDVLRRLAEERQRESNPAVATLVEVKTLLEAVESDPIRRLRLRGLLSRVIDRINVLIVPSRSRKLCNVQIHFKDGQWRDYLIAYSPGRRGSKTYWQAMSWSKGDVVNMGVDPTNADGRERMEADTECYLVRLLENAKVVFAGCKVHKLP